MFKSCRVFPGGFVRTGLLHPVTQWVVMSEDWNKDVVSEEVKERGPMLLQSMIELSRTQDEQVGDGTTSVIILGEPVVCSPRETSGLW